MSPIKALNTYVPYLKRLAVARTYKWGLRVSDKALQWEFYATFTLSRVSPEELVPGFPRVKGRAGFPPAKRFLVFLLPSRTVTKRLRFSRLFPSPPM